MSDIIRGTTVNLREERYRPICTRKRQNVTLVETVISQHAKCEVRR